MPRFEERLVVGMGWQTYEPGESSALAQSTKQSWIAIHFALHELPGCSWISSQSSRDINKRSSKARAWRAKSVATCPRDIFELRRIVESSVATWTTLQ